jgi:small subunit ribosomal protein S15
MQGLENVIESIIDFIRKREKGKSHSTRPITPNEELLYQTNPEEIRKIIIDLAKKGTPPSMIGVILRDQYGIPLVKHLFGKKLTDILAEEKLLPSIPEDLANLIKKAEIILKHLKEHPKDYRSKRGLLIQLDLLHLMKNYFIKLILKK